MRPTGKNLSASHLTNLLMFSGVTLYKLQSIMRFRVLPKGWRFIGMAFCKRSHSRETDFTNVLKDCADT